MSFHCLSLSPLFTQQYYNTLATSNALAAQLNSQECWNLAFVHLYDFKSSHENGKSACVILVLNVIYLEEG